MFSLNFPSPLHLEFRASPNVNRTKSLSNFLLVPSHHRTWAHLSKVRINFGLRGIFVVFCHQKVELSPDRTEHSPQQLSGKYNTGTARSSCSRPLRVSPPPPTSTSTESSPTANICTRAHQAN